MPDSSEEIVALIAQSQRRLYAFVLSLVRRPGDVEDILQEVNIVLWRKRDMFQPGTEFVAWAFEIARLQVLAFRAKQVRHRDPFDDSLLAEIADTAVMESAMFDLREVALRGCLEKLPEEQRTLIVQRYQPAASVNLLAAQMSKTAKAVSESLRRIRESLRQCIERTLAAESRS